MPYPSKTDREAIVAVAMEQLAEGGLRELSLRSVAATLGLAPNALYRYFENKSQLEAALAAESIRRQHLALKRAAGNKEPQKAILAIADAYLGFAREHPHLYSTMMSVDAGRESASVHGQSWGFVVDLVGRLSGATHAREAAVALWAFLHGMTTLEAARVFGDAKPSRGFEWGLKAWLEAASRAARGTDR